MELTNKSLAVLLLAAMVISLGGTVISLNKIKQVEYVGYATTATGTIDLTVAGLASITSVDNNAINFGTCAPITGIGIVANVTSDLLENTTVVCPTFSTLDNISIRNDGNVNASVTLQPSLCAPGVGNTSCTFLASSSNSALFMYKTAMGGTGYTNGCTGTLVGSYTAFNGTQSGFTACSKLLYGVNNNSFVTHYKVGVPYDAPLGAATVTITYSAIQV
jgi:hypothetical protein